MTSHASALNNHPKEAKSIIANPPGKINRRFYNVVIPLDFCSCIIYNKAVAKVRCWNVAKDRSSNQRNQ